MPSQPRNMPEQEHSIRARSDELFVEDAPVLPARSTKPFAAFLRETPARPISPALKALFWLVGVIVGVLFLLAIWRVSHRHGSSPRAGAAPAKVAMSHESGKGLASGSRVV